MCIYDKIQIRLLHQLHSWRAYLESMWNELSQMITLNLNNEMSVLFQPKYE